MSVYSMTGYASSQGRLDTPGQPLSIAVELRSVNSRFLDLVFKVPDDIKPLEGSLRQLLTAQLVRGKVELRIALHREVVAGGGLNLAALHQLRATQMQIQNWLPEARELSVAEVIHLLHDQREAERPVEWSEALEAIVLEAVHALKHARQGEGARLAKVLDDKVLQLRQLVAKAQPLVPQLVEQQRQKFLDRWNEALGVASQGGARAMDSKDVEQRAIAEATAFAIRVDVAEELARLGSHLDEVERLLQQGGAIGKRLDFLMQELHREANTLGSKSALIEMSRISMEMKVLIEQMREQVQNIE